MTDETPAKAKALKVLATRQARLVKANTEANTYAEERDLAAAQARKAGASYAELQTATSLSEARITQILRRNR